jgi:hypothetical protein
MNNQKTITQEQKTILFELLKARCNKRKKTNPELDWVKVQEKLNNQPIKIWSLYQMELTGGEPEVVFYDKNTNEFVFFDCSAESPSGRRSLCYDHQALEARKEHKPENSALNLANEIGMEILSENEYRELQKLGNFDTKTSSWIKTPSEIRALGGALFADFRYNTTFIYHNGAQSYYGSRGFRGSLRV